MDVSVGWVAPGMFSLLRSRKSVTLWNLTFQYVNVFISIGSGLLMVPFYLRHISARDYGLWLASGNILVWVTMLDPGLSTIIQQKVASCYGGGNRKELGQWMLAGVAASMVLCFVLVVVGLIASMCIERLLGFESTDMALGLRQAFLIAVFGNILIIFSFALTAISLGLQSGIGIGVMSVTTKALALGLTVLLLTRDAGFFAFAWASVFTGALFVLWNILYLVWRSRKESFFSATDLNLGRLLSIAKLSSLTFAGRATQMFAANIDMIAVARVLGPEHATMLSLHRRALETSRMFVDRPSAAFMPAISHLSGSKDEGKLRLVIVRLLRFIIWTAALLVGGFLSFNQAFVSLWVGSGYYGGPFLNFALCVLFLGSTLAMAFQNLCYALGDIKNSSLVLFGQSCLAIVLIIVCTSCFGLLGAVVGQACAVCLVSFWYFPKKLSEQLDLKAAGIKAVLRDGGVSLAAMAIASAAVWHVEIRAWSSLVLMALIYIVIFVTVLACISDALRGELKSLVKLGKKNPVAVDFSGA